MPVSAATIVINPPRRLYVSKSARRKADGDGPTTSGEAGAIGALVRCGRSLKNVPMLDAAVHPYAVPSAPETRTYCPLVSLSQTRVQYGIRACVGVKFGGPECTSASRSRTTCTGAD